MAFGLSAGAIGAIGAVGGAAIGASASRSAAKKQAGAVDAATAAQQAQFDQQMALLEPYRYGGEKANNALLDLLGLRSTAETNSYNDLFDKYYADDKAAFNAAHASGHGFGIDDAPAWAQADMLYQDQRIREAAKQRAEADAAKAQASAPQNPTSASFGSLMKPFGMEDFEADPGYQFRMDEGMRGVEGGAAARGGLLSGAALKAIQKYGQGLASQEYGNAYNRYTSNQTNQYNRLMGLVGAGQGSASQTANAAGQFGQAQANNLIGAGNAAAAGTMGQANALVGGINQGFNNYQQNELMKLIRDPSKNQGSWGSTGWGSGGYGSGYAYGNRDMGENL